MRLFIAIDIPEEIKSYFRELQKELRDFEDLAELRWVKDFHLTLKFLGSCDDVKKKKIEEILKSMPFQSFTARLTEIGVFTFRGWPRVVWVGISVPQWLFETQKKIEEALSRLGFEKENRFEPHLTLARVKEVKESKSFLEKVKEIKVESKTFPVSHFYLFESQLSPQGATYTKLAEFG